MTFKDSVTVCLIGKYATFSGRAGRSEYWWFALAMFLYALTLIALFFAVNGVTGGFATESGLSSTGLLVLILGGIGVFALILPGIALTVRRFHDVNLSGWWVLAGIALGGVPILGWIARIAILVIALRAGTVGENRFGPDPSAQP